MSSTPRWLIVAAAVVLMIMGAGLQRWLAAPPVEPAASVPARADAGKPGVLELGSDTCASCRAMIKVLDELRERHGDTMRIESYNIRKDAQMLSKWNIMAIPTIVFVDADGRELTRHIGYLSADEIDAQFHRLGIAGRDR
jgi:thioredoxin 1